MSGPEVDLSGFPEALAEAWCRLAPPPEGGDSVVWKSDRRPAGLADGEECIVHAALSPSGRTAHSFRVVRRGGRWSIMLVQ